MIHPDLDKVDARWRYVVCDVHALSFFLHPEHVGEPLQGEFHTRFVNAVQKHVGPVAQMDALRQFGLFRTRQGPFSGRSPIWLHSNQPEVFWGLLQTEAPILAGLAFRVFKVTAHSEASERAFFTHNHIHLDDRATLTPERTMKLAFIYCNHRALQDTRYHVQWRQQVQDARTVPDESSDDEESE
ncbi:hypothetical protein DFS34DRAFT_202914 [Phlyctochytrium arcticum]|nr:hypothetical protein DFS34DRAFT_202914 [Phlyctochytrium arcticum]